MDINVYYRELAKYPRLTPQEEKRLARKCADGDMQARNQLIRANLRFVVHVAKSYGQKGLVLEEIISAGNLGLIHAAEKFRAEKNCRFSTYAQFWIRQKIRHHSNSVNFYSFLTIQRNTYL